MKTDATKLTTTANEKSMPIYLTQEAQQIAQLFAQQQQSESKAKQVQYNTLAVYAVNNYLKILGISANSSNCDSWNLLMQMTTNVADLSITGLGRVECRPISRVELERQSACYVPTEVQGDRIAYIVVQVELDQPYASILGFVSQVNGDIIPLDQLQPITRLPMYFQQYPTTVLSTGSSAGVETASLAESSAELSAELSVVVETVTHFSDWVQGQIHSNWQPLDVLLRIEQFQTVWRNNIAPSSPKLSAVIRGKIIGFSDHIQNSSITLIAELLPQSETQFDVELKVIPNNGHEFLPTALEMMIVDENSDVVMQAQARQENRMIELGFHAQVGDRFSVRIKLRDIVIDEAFVV